MYLGSVPGNRCHSHVSLPQFLICKMDHLLGLLLFSKLVQIQCCPPFPCSFQPQARLTRSPTRSPLSTWNLDRCPGAAGTLGSPGPGSCPDSWGPGAWTPGVCQQARSRVPEAEWQGLGSRGLFVPLWRMAGVGSLRNRPKIVRATGTSRTHQCTPLCNNTNFVAAEKSIFSP